MADPYTLKNVQGVKEEIEALEIAGVIAKSIFPLVTLIATVQESSPRGATENMHVCRLPCSKFFLTQNRKDIF